MCSRFSLVTELQELKTYYQAQITGSLLSHPPSIEQYSVAPSQVTLAVIWKNNQPTLIQVQWGIPLPVKTKSGSSKSRIKPIINLRTETLTTKPIFKKMLFENRCVIPVTGFYEWARNGRLNQPYYFTVPNHLLSLAAICVNPHSISYRDHPSASLYFALLTIAAPLQYEKIHDRFPLLLPNDQVLPWLQPTTPLKTITQIIQSPSPFDLTYYMVTERVNKATYNNPDAIRPLASQKSIDDFF